MKRLHVHVAVPEIEGAVRFYSTLFGVGPTVAKPDYAKWMLDDPRVNFAISARGAAPGVNHLGIQAEDEAELADLRAKLDAADGAVFDEGETTCCYARSDKAWITDPAGVAWEAYHTMGEAKTFGASPDLNLAALQAALAPQAAPAAKACCG